MEIYLIPLKKFDNYMLLKKLVTNYDVKLILQQIEKNNFYKSLQYIIIRFYEKL